MDKNGTARRITVAGAVPGKNTHLMTLCHELPAQRRAHKTGPACHKNAHWDLLSEKNGLWKKYPGCPATRIHSERPFSHLYPEKRMVILLL
jgi:hypothetical protein